MDTFIVAVLPTDEAAFKAGENLRDLHKQALVTVHAAAIISKDNEGNLALQQAAEEGPVGAATGALVGAIIGVLAGPAALATGAVAGSAAALAGMAAGSATGGLLGMTSDLVKSGIDSDFLEMVEIELSPGRSALVASVDEGWSLPLDKAVADLGGRLFRQERVEIIDDNLEREALALEKELDRLIVEFHASREADRDYLRSRISDIESKLEKLLTRVRKRESQVKAETDDRLDALNAQIRNASGGARDRFQKRKAALEAETSLKIGKLEQASSTASDALVRANV